MTVKTDRLITLFGGGGFIGRYAVQAFFKAGCRVRIAEREPKRAFSLKPLAGLGQIQFVRADLADQGAVAGACHGADAVVNLVGILKGDFHKVHVEGARTIAKAAAAAGVPALVHVSAIGADVGSESAYGASKGEGEAAVRAACPHATILRPSIVFGMEDDFTNKFARMARLLPILPVIRGGWRLQPVHVADLGKAIALAGLDPRSHAGKTYELGGPEVMTMAELNRWLSRAAGRDPPVIEIPDAVGGLIARLGFLPGAPMTWDQWLMLQHDSIAAGPGFDAFGIRPVPLASVAEEWLTLYRRQGRFAKPSVS